MSNQQLAACRPERGGTGPTGTGIADRKGQTGGGSRGEEGPNGRGSQIDGPDGTRITNQTGQRDADHAEQERPMANKRELTWLSALGSERSIRAIRVQSGPSIRLPFGRSICVVGPADRPGFPSKMFDPLPRPVSLWMRSAMRFVNISVRRCSVRNRLAISIQPVGHSNSTGTRKCAAWPLARTRLGPVDFWHRLLLILVETFEKRLVSNRASGKYASLESEPVASGTGIAHICGTAILAAAPRSICGVAPLV